MNNIKKEETDDTKYFVFFAQKQTIYFQKPYQDIQREIEGELKENPNDIKSLLILGQIECKYNGKEKEAFQIYKQILQLDPQNIDARIDILLMLIRKYGKNIQKSKILIDECFKIDSNYWRTYYALSVYYLFIGEQLLGKACLADAHQKFPNELWITVFYAQMQSEYKQNAKKVEQMIESIIENSKLDFETALRIAYSYGTIQKEEQSEKYLQIAINLNPNSPKANNNFGYFYRYVKKDYEKCKQYCQRAIELDSNNEDSYYNLSICYQKDQDYEQSVSMLKKCLQINPSQQYAQQELAYNLLINLKQASQAEQIVMKLLKKFPNNQYGSYVYCFIYNQENHLKLQDLEKMQEIKFRLLNNISLRGSRYDFIDYNRFSRQLNSIFKK